MCDFIQSWSDREAGGNKQEVRCSVIIYLAYLFTCKLRVSTNLSYCMNSWRKWG
jgi:hypothetical protein